MDMRKILQTLDNKSALPYVDESNDMKKFMSIISEGANPHKVSLPVQMAMQHYTLAQIKEPVKKPSLFKQYVAEAEEAVVQRHEEKQDLIKQYSRIIADRVRLKESSKFKSIVPSSISNTPDKDENPKDVVSMDIPLLIRILEYAREDAKTDMDLHNVTEKLIEFSTSSDVLTMDHYDAIVGEQKLLEPLKDMQ
jgi:hypothetical protein